MSDFTRSWFSWWRPKSLRKY